MWSLRQNKLQEKGVGILNDKFYAKWLSEIYQFFQFSIETLCSWNIVCCWVYLLFNTNQCKAVFWWLRKNFLRPMPSQMRLLSSFLLRTSFFLCIHILAFVSSTVDSNFKQNQNFFELKLHNCNYAKYNTQPPTFSNFVEDLDIVMAWNYCWAWISVGFPLLELKSEPARFIMKIYFNSTFGSS